MVVHTCRSPYNRLADHPTMHRHPGALPVSKAGLALFVARHASLAYLWRRIHVCHLAAVACVGFRTADSQAIWALTTMAAIEPGKAISGEPTYRTAGADATARGWPSTRLYLAGCDLSRAGAQFVAAGNALAGLSERSRPHLLPRRDAPIIRPSSSAVTLPKAVCGARCLIGLRPAGHPACVDSPITARHMFRKLRRV